MPTTQVTKRFIADGAIDDSKVQAGAGIASSKLADGGNFTKRDGSVPMIGNLNMGGQKITNVATGSGAGDAVNFGQLQSALDSINSLFDAKGSVKAVSWNDATQYPGTSTFDGVTVNIGDRLLVMGQAVLDKQGIYVFNGPLVPMTRSADMDSWAEVPGAFVAVEQGTVYGDTIWLCTSNSGGTLFVDGVNASGTPVTFQQIPTTAGLSHNNFVAKEIPSGAINGSNVTYTLASVPVAGSELVFVNGLLMESGAGNDYTISGATLTMLGALATGEKIRVNYRK